MMWVHIMDLVAVVLGLTGGLLQAHTSEHPLIGKTMWGGNPVTEKFERVDRFVRGVGIGLMVIAAAIGAARIFLLSRPVDESLSVLLAFAALAVAGLLTAGLTAALRKLAVQWSRRVWWQPACEAVRPRVSRLEELVELGGVWPERRGEIEKWPQSEFERVREMDSTQAGESLATYETLLELDQRGTIGERVARLRSLVGPDTEQL